MRRRQYLQRTNRVASAPEPDRQAPIHLSPGFGELLHLDDPYSNRCFARQLNKTELIRNSDPAIRVGSPFEMMAMLVLSKLEAGESLYY
jgi:hypothetical protein